MVLALLVTFCSYTQLQIALAQALDFAIACRCCYAQLLSVNFPTKHKKKENNNFLRWGAVGVNNFYRFNLFVCIMCVYLHHTIMRRFNFFIEQKWIDRIKRDMKKHGFTSVSSFIRHIIIKFFDKNI